jgi:hopene-associated glycosyltransferase HpnB
VGALKVATVGSGAAWLYLLSGRGSFWRADVRLPAADPPGGWPSVAVVVPARDEAAVLPRTLPRLLDQRYPGSLHVVVVDDRSRDGTGELAARLAADLGRSSGLVVVDGSGPPPGWSGKLWALRQGVERAGEVDYLLFTDADIQHPTDSVARLTAVAVDRGLDLVSLMARLRAVTRWERLIVPAFVYFFAQLYPFRWVNRRRCRSAAAAGGCVLVRRPALRTAGGLEAICGAVIDDVALARAFKRSGASIWIGLADEVESVRSYDRLADLWNMVARSAFTQLRGSALLLGLTIAGLALVYGVPPAAFVIFAAGGHLGWAAGAAACWLAMAASFVPTLSYYGVNPVAAVALPFTAGMYAAMSIDSAVRHWRGRGVAWKGRRYAPAGIVAGR